MLRPTFAFNHNQATASETWTINHGMHCKPSVAVQVLFEGQLQTIIPHSITYPDDMTAVVGFTMPFSGTARLF